MRSTVPATAVPLEFRHSTVIALVVLETILAVTAVVPCNAVTDTLSTERNVFVKLTAVPLDEIDASLILSTTSG